MNYFAYSDKWHKLSEHEISNIFNNVFKDVACLPGIAIIEELKKLNIGIIELLENTTFSTVYRIRPTNTKYSVSKTYFTDKPDDCIKLINHTSFESLYSKEPVHGISFDKDNYCVERLKVPRFKAKFNPDNLDIFDIIWIDNASNQESIIKKAHAFIKNYYGRRKK